MLVAKTIELSGQSPTSYEDAIREAVEQAARTLRDIQSVSVKEFEAVVESGRVTEFRAILTITFVLDEGTSVEAMREGDAADLSDTLREIIPPLGA